MQNVFGTPPTGTPTTIVPDSAGHITLPLVSQWASVPWWLENGFQKGTDMFNLPTSGLTSHNAVIGEDRVADTHVRAALRIAGVSFVYDDGPVVYRVADPARGELRRPVASVPAISLTFDDEVEYARVGTALDREYALHVTSAASGPRDVTIDFSLPKGLTVDSAVRHVALLPQRRRFGRNLDHAGGSARPQLDARVHRIGDVETVDGERIQVNARRKRTERHTPHARGVLGHAVVEAQTGHDGARKDRVRGDDQDAADRSH